ncbi:MAG: hypothetical protein ABUT39_29390 [Acidobacteriota bacterium]
MPGKSGIKLEFDPVVAAVVKDVAHPPEVRMLAGLLGPGPDESTCRLYSPDLAGYVQLPRSAILHAEKVQGPYGAMTMLWWSGGTKADLVEGGALRMLQGELEGDLKAAGAEAFQAGTSAGLRATGITWGTWTLNIEPCCLSWAFSCRRCAV